MPEHRTKETTMDKKQTMETPSSIDRIYGRTRNRTKYIYRLIKNVDKLCNQEQNKMTWILFIDFAKAYDTVN